MNKNRSILLSATLSNLIGYYNFTIYVVFSLAIGKAFFPSDDELVQILSSLGVFAVSFVGQLISGYIADRHGRRVSLITSMLGMTIPAFSIGLIPEYSQIGYLAPLILVIMRLIQGLCIGGEGTVVTIFILEHYQHLRPGFAVGIVQASKIAGALFATLTGILLATFIPNTDFAWRLVFMFGGVMGIIGFYFRLRVPETPIFAMLSEKKQTLKSPFLHVIKTAKKSMFITFTLFACASSVTHLIKTYINIYHCNILHFDDAAARLYLAYSAIIMMLTMPLSGYISDHIGRFKMITYAAISIFVLALPTLLLMSCEDTWRQLIALTILAMLGGSIICISCIFIIPLFASNQRCTGVALSYSLSPVLLAGISLAISCYLPKSTEIYYAPAFYSMLTSGFFLITIYFMRHYIRKLLDANRRYPLDTIG